MTPQSDELRMVPLSKIKPWPGNPRKTFDESKIAALGESIKEQGILQPLLLRPTPTDQVSKDVRTFKKNLGGDELADGYQIADGERRFRAATLAQLKVVPSIVRELTDREMYEISLVSEGQREDLPPLERAEGVAKLVNYYDGRVDDAAKKLGKSASAVRAAMRLQLLPDKAKKAVAGGELNVSVAELVAARPSADMREQVADFACKPVERWQNGQRVKELPSVRQVRDWVKTHCMVELKQAPFNPNEASLTSAGACTSCPKRTGNNREDYPDGRADICTDTTCFGAKVEAWKARLIETAKASGQTVVDAAEAKKLFPYHDDLSAAANYFDLKDPCWEDKYKKTHRSYKQLLEPHVEQKDIVLCFAPSGQVHRLVNKAVALPILQKEHKLFKTATQATFGRGLSDHDKAEAARRRKENELSRARDNLLLAAAAAQGESWAAQVPKWPGGITKLLQAMLPRYLSYLWDDRLQLVCKRRGLKVDGSFEKRKAIEDLAGNMEVSTLCGLLAEVTVACDGLNTYGGGKKCKLQELFGLDPAQALKEAKADMTGKKKGPSKVKAPSANGNAKKRPRAAAAK